MKQSFFLMVCMLVCLVALYAARMVQADIDPEKEIFWVGEEITFSTVGEDTSLITLDREDSLGTTELLAYNYFTQVIIYPPNDTIPIYQGDWSEEAQDYLMGQRVVAYLHAITDDSDTSRLDSKFRLMRGTFVIMGESKELPGSVNWRIKRGKVEIDCSSDEYGPSKCTLAIGDSNTVDGLLDTSTYVHITCSDRHVDEGYWVNTLQYKVQKYNQEAVVLWAEYVRGHQPHNVITKVFFHLLPSDEVVKQGKEPEIRLTPHGD